MNKNINNADLLVLLLGIIRKEEDKLRKELNKKLDEELSNIQNTPLIIEGLPGEDGPAGPPGAQGVEGERGPAGEKGDTGTGVTLKGSVADYEELKNIQDVLVSDLYVVLNENNAYIWNGVDWDNVGKIQGPKGVKGDRGDPGPQGTVGPQGSQGIQGFTGETGPTGPQGKVGPAGPRGNVGATGAKGDQGLTGDVGPIGPEGKRGLTGKTGPIGPQGDIGPKGDTGESGPKGLDGEKGPRGDKGDKGDKGDRGETGAQGEQGIPGRDGDTPDVAPIEKNLNKLFEDFKGSITAQVTRLNLGGGGSSGSGEVRLEFLDDVDRDSAKTDGAFLKFDVASGKFVGAVPSAGSDIDLSAVDQHIIPSLDSTYDLGTPTKKWRNLFVSANTIFLGNNSLSISEEGNLLVNNELFTGEAGPQGEGSLDDIIVYAIALG